MFPDDGVHIQKTDSVAAPVPLRGGNPPVFNSYGDFYRISDRQNQSVLFLHHFELNDSVFRQLLTCLDGIIQKIDKKRYEFLFSERKFRQIIDRYSHCNIFVQRILKFSIQHYVYHHMIRIHQINAFFQVSGQTGKIF